MTGVRDDLAMTLRRALLALLPLTLGCSHLLLGAPAGVFDEGQAGRGRLALREGLALVTVEGTPEEIGAQLGALVGEQARDLRDAYFDALEPDEAMRGAARALEPAIPDHVRRELQAVARASGLPYEDLTLANTLVDFGCTAFVASGAATTTGELLFARNMDYPGAHLLGRGTLVLLVRGEGRKAYVALTWPGMSGVVTGMNEDGLCAAILVNLDGAVATAGGTPVGFLVREVLERCASVDEARALLRERPAAVNHLVMLADATTGAVCATGLEDRLPSGGTLTCSNAPADDRARVLAEVVGARRGRIDAAEARRILTATYVEYIATQAMLFEPGARRVWLALGTSLRPAACQDWTRLELAPAFARGDLGAAAVVAEDGVEPLAHYTEEGAYGREPGKLDGLRSALGVEAR